MNSAQNLNIEAETAPLSPPRPKCYLETRLRWQLAATASEASAQQGDVSSKTSERAGKH